MQKIFLINDYQLYNVRYRLPLVNSLRQGDFKLFEKGIFDNLAYIPFLIISLIFVRNKIIISSNIRTNIISLLFLNGKKVVILNGLGRHRDRWLLRAVLRFGINNSSKSEIIIQNYADYRFFRRFTEGKNLTWLPGSGGSQKKIGPKSNWVIVQRDDKISLVSEDLKKLFRIKKETNEISIVGCVDDLQLMRLFAGFDFKSNGFVDASNILESGGTFVQPSGYGEGFPHSLADAIVSDMDVYISDREFLKLGFGKLSCKKKTLAPGWSQLIYKSGLSNDLSYQLVTKIILDKLEKIRTLR